MLSQLENIIKSKRANSFLIISEKDIQENLIPKILSKIKKYTNQTNSRTPDVRLPTSDSRRPRVLGGGEILVIDPFKKRDWIKKTSKLGKIYIDDIRFIKKFLSTKPIFFPYKIVFIKNSELATTEAWNSFLKTLEEPPEYSLIFLFAENITNIPKTIISRTTIIKTKTHKTFQKKEKKELSNFLKLRSLDEKIEFLDKFFYHKNKEEALKFLDELIIHFYKKKEYKNIETILKYKKIIENININPVDFTKKLTYQLYGERFFGPN